MDIKLLTKEQDTIRFVLSDVSPAFANALRRIILAEVPVMAIEDVMILENSSVMYDEIMTSSIAMTGTSARIMRRSALANAGETSDRTKRIVSCSLVRSFMSI